MLVLGLLLQANWAVHGELHVKGLLLRFLWCVGGACFYRGFLRVDIE